MDQLIPKLEYQVFSILRDAPIEKQKELIENIMKFCEIVSVQRWIKDKSKYNDFGLSYSCICQLLLNTQEMNHNDEGKIISDFTLKRADYVIVTLIEKSSTEQLIEDSNAYYPDNYIFNKGRNLDTDQDSIENKTNIIRKNFNNVWIALEKVNIEDLEWYGAFLKSEPLAKIILNIRSFEKFRKYWEDPCL